MKIIYIIILSGFSVIVLFLLTKLMGNKQISQLTSFDYIIGISIGSIAAEMSTSVDDGFEKPLTAMICYGVFASVLSVLTTKFIGLRRIIDGRSLLLFENGKMYKKNFKKARLNINEFLTECRLLGFGNLADIQTAILEPNGKISVIPKSVARPPTTREMNIIPPEEKPPTAIVIDGIILKNNLKYTGNNEIWLKNEMKNQKIKALSDIFYATCDSENNLSIYTTVNEMPDYDLFS